MKTSNNFNMTIKKYQVFFVPDYIRATLLGGYFLRYPRSLLFSNQDPTNVTVYYDYAFFNYLRSLLHLEQSFLGFRPGSFFYAIFVGFFIRFLWFFGASRRLFPAYSSTTPSSMQLFGFYEIWFTPLATLYSLWFGLKLFFSKPKQLHYAFNRNFTAYSDGFWFFLSSDFSKSGQPLPSKIYPATFIKLYLFFDLAFFSRLFGTFFSRFLVDIALFFCSFFVHFLFRPVFGVFCFLTDLFCETFRLSEFFLKTFPFLVLRGCGSFCEHL